MDTRTPIPGVAVHLRGRTVAETDSLGRFEILGPVMGANRLRFSRIGYASSDTVVVVGVHDVEVEVYLNPEPVAVEAVTARSNRPTGGAERERELFEREPRPGVVGLSGEELRNGPSLVEADVLRSLQTVPGVVQLNDLSAELFVRGGAPDQNLFLLDGARIFAPYHLFGIFGAISADVIGRAEFYRASIPARYGGALSSVVAMEQRRGADALSVDAGVSFLALRATATGRLPGDRGDWLVSARRTHADVAAKVLERDFPYAFHDASGRLALTVGGDHRLQASVFTSSDRFQLFFEGLNPDLASSWRNAAGTMEWSKSVAGSPWTLTGQAWGSQYGADLRISAPGGPWTTQVLSAGGLRFQVLRTTDRSGLRIGAEIETGSVAIDAEDRPGGYLTGSTAGEYSLPASFLEVERWVGIVRLAPGLRLALRAPGGGFLLEPRIAARIHLTPDFALTASAGRSHQVLSTLRDDRYTLPGPPFWYVHADSTPPSRTDDLSLAVDGWLGQVWSFSGAVYARAFEDVSRWRPVGARTIESVRYDDGGSYGAELFLRRHGSRLRGWVGYGFARTTLTEQESGIAYAPVWDRRHSFDLTVTSQVWRDLSVTARATFGTGLPFWPPAGGTAGYRFRPNEGGIGESDPVPLWGTKQDRFPDYFRFDVSARNPFSIGSLELEPFLDVLNLTRRSNVLYYAFPNGYVTHYVGGSSSGPFEEVEIELHPYHVFPIPVTVSLGLVVRL